MGDALTRKRIGAVLTVLGLILGVFESGCSGCGGTGQSLTLPDGSEGPRMDAHETAPGVDAGHDATKRAPVDAGTGEDASNAGDADDAGFSFVHAIAPFDAHVDPGSPLRCADGGVTTAYLFDEKGALYTFSPATLEATLLGTPSCIADASAKATPWTLSVSHEGIAYLVYEDWSIYAVDLATLACTETAFKTGQLGIDVDFGIAVSRATTDETFYVFRQPGDAGALLTSSDLTDFDLTAVGAPEGLPTTLGVYDTQADLFGHLFAYSQGGVLAELDLVTGALLGGNLTGFPPTSSVVASWAVMTYGSDVYLFAGQQVARYDFDTQEAVVIGDVSNMETSSIVGASAVPCYSGP